MLGLGQGVILALAVAAAMHEEETGGVILFGSPLPTDPSLPRETRAKTPVLVLGGREKLWLPRVTLRRSKDASEKLNIGSGKGKEMASPGIRRR